MEKRRVILFGRSIILGTIGASLRRYPDLEIIPLSLPLPDVQVIRDLAPHVILYDLESAHPEHALTLLETYPELLLIGVNPDTNQVLVWSGRNLRELSTLDLVQMINDSDSVFSPSAGDSHE